MRILVPTFPHDVHAVEVALVLREAGHEVALWHGADFPTRQHATVDFSGPMPVWEVGGSGLAIDSRPFDVVWHRRATPPVLPERMHPGDRPVAQRECEDFVAGLWQLVSPDAFWVNRMEARARAKLKLVQLAEARAAGLEIPRTLSSNDPARIRAFLAELGGPAVYKAFYPAQWEHGNELAVLLTAEVSAERLPPDPVLRLTPGIWQAKLEKRHELRVTAMGERLIAARLLSQDHEATRVDWRARSVDLRVEPDELAPDVERGLRELMRRLGIVFGCIDLVVTPEGRHVFLEVNPMGQFLWIEHGCPDVRLLGPFCDFLVAGGHPGVDPAFDHVRHADWFERANAFIAANEEAHVRWQDPYVVPDSPRTPSPGRSGTGVPVPGA